LVLGEYSPDDGDRLLAPVPTLPAEFAALSAMVGRGLNGPVPDA
jgi:hypothetical protein